MGAMQGPVDAQGPEDGTKMEPATDEGFMRIGYRGARGRGYIGPSVGTQVKNSVSGVYDGRRLTRLGTPPVCKPVLKRCFISNLSFKTSWQDLKDKFREVGNVVYANVTRDENGKSRGWGIVEYETPEEAVEAVNAFNGEEMAGRKIVVREDREDRDVKQYNKENGIERPNTRRPKRGGRDSAARGDGGGRRAAPQETHQSSGLQVVVQGIPWAYTDQDLEGLFHEVGTVEQASVVYSKDGRSRGYGTVRFTSKEDAEKAIADFHGTDLEGRALAVKIDKFM